MMNRKVALIAFALTLVSCSNSTETASKPADGARTEVLPGTISDAMLDTDQLRKQAPLIEFTPSALPKIIPSSDHSGLPAHGTLGDSKAPGFTSTSGADDATQLGPKPAAR